MRTGHFFFQASRCAAFVLAALATGTVMAQDANSTPTAPRS